MKDGIENERMHFSVTIWLIVHESNMVDWLMGLKLIQPHLLFVTLNTVRKSN
jgi:hypothetical protein